MANKIFKTILLFSLCIVVTISSNAAVSVSDGSAFVTKSEFTADLNNLSNRMASLENSLDAKIDSLVSSYLTRNGIWNGSAQELKEGGFIQKEFGVFELYGPPVTFSSKPLSAFRDNIYGEADLFTANKTGLLCISVGTYGAYSGGTYYTDNRRFFCYAISDNTEITNFDAIQDDHTAAQSAIIDWSSGCYLGWEILDGTEIKTALNLVSSRPISKVRRWLNNDSQHTTGYMIEYRNFYTLLQCFVEKDKTYKQRLRFKYNQGGRTNDRISFTVGEYFDNTWRMIIDFANIY